jgi:phosphopantetheinyl transferase
MGIYRQIHINKQSVITIWEISESEEGLFERTRALNVWEQAHAYKAQLQRKQFLAAQLLLEHLGVRHFILKDENGKPHLSDRQYISITHDSNYVAVMVADYPCGVDLQTVTEKVKRIAPKFLDKNDCIQDWNNLFMLTVGWSAKEALYKIHGNPLLFFKEHIRLSEFTKHDNSIQAQIFNLNQWEEYKIQYQQVDDVVLCFIDTPSSMNNLTN